MDGQLTDAGCYRSECNEYLAIMTADGLLGCYITCWQLDPVVSNHANPYTARSNLQPQFNGLKPGNLDSSLDNRSLYIQRYKDTVSSMSPGIPSVTYAWKHAYCICLQRYLRDVGSLNNNLIYSRLKVGLHVTPWRMELNNFKNYQFIAGYLGDHLSLAARIPSWVT